MNVTTQVFVHRYSSTYSFEKRVWRWGVTAYVEPDVGKMRTDYQMGFKTKAEARAAGDAWAAAQVADIQAKALQTKTKAEAAAIIDEALYGTPFEEPQS